MLHDMHYKGRGDFKDRLDLDFSDNLEQENPLDIISRENFQKNQDSQNDAE
mgnify:CR=1 FL=1